MTAWPLQAGLNLDYSDRYEKDCFIKDNPEEFAEAIMRLLKDANLQDSIAVSAFESTKGMLDTESLLKRRLDFYSQC